MNSTAEEYNTLFREKMNFNTVLTSLLLFFGVAGNAIVLYFYAIRMTRTKDRFFIPFLAAVDLIACVFGCAFSIVTNLYRLVFIWENLCKFIYFSYAFTTCLSALMLFVIALDRYLKVCRPHRAQMTMQKRGIAIFCSVLGSILASLPMLYFLGKVNGSVNLKDMNVNVTCCGLKQERIGIVSRFYFYLMVAFIIINIMCTVALYIPVGITIYKRFDHIRNSKSISKLLGPINHVLADDEKSEGKSENRRGIKSNNLQNIMDTSACKNAQRRRVRNNFTSMFIAIVVCYVISYVPSLILIFVATKYPFKFWFSLDNLSLNVLMILGRSNIINPILNPYIYAYFDLNFRKQFIQSVFICKER
jgi:hypothetical protein